MNPATVRSIAVFKLNHLGDAVTFLPTVAGLRAALPDAAILVVSSAATAVLYSRSIPGISVLPVNMGTARNGLSAGNLARLAWHLRTKGVDEALLSFDEPALAYCAAWLGGARHRIGFDLCGHRLQPSLTELIQGGVGRNVVDINFDLVRRISGQGDLAPRRVPVGYDSADQDAVAQRLATAGIGRGTRFVLLHAHSKHAYQRWPLANYRALSARLATAGLPTVALTQGFGQPVGEAVCLDGLTLPQLAALSAQARLFIGNNSGPMHVAASVGTPTLAIQGPTSPEWNIPWKDVPHEHLTAQNVACVPCDRLGRASDGQCANHQAPLACMNAVDVDRVFERAHALMAGA
ncbi:glycosyltransferase family 9 protein [Nitrospirillum iridis]|uniref:ADP-heptose:LPS heptosyltransferase n=1 Tax=Nitrospirillum iridis TaxID=765888 RepID=A0A7X0B3F2_9PROT|nr:glycosyltransferase family 9 protein [Nitrospirillum iridis]MBB6253701.1 ADP-heptose:LPS heptosyltransferase [Nitrospirillum iridis]